MADANTSLPVRTQTNGDVVVEVADGTTPSQKLAIDASGRVTTKMDDGAGNAITSQTNGAQRALDVGIDVAGVQIDPRQIRALTSADVVSAAQSGTWTVQPGNTPNTAPWLTTISQGGNSASVSASNALKVDGSAVTQPVSGTVTANAGTGTFTTSDLADGSVSGGTAGTKSLLAGLTFNTVAPTLTTGQQASLQGDSSGNLKTSLQTAIPAGANAIGSVLANLQVASAAVSNTNPVPVSITTTAPGLAVQDYHTSASLAAGASVTFTYTVVAAHTFNLERVWASASGKIKAIVQNGATNMFAGFNSTATPNIDITVQSPPTIAAAGTVNVIITNDDIQAMDVYCTIEGNQN